MQRPSSNKKKNKKPKTMQAMSIEPSFSPPAPPSALSASEQKARRIKLLLISLGAVLFLYLATSAWEHPVTGDPPSGSVSDSNTAPMPDNPATAKDPSTTAHLSYKLLRSFPHDTMSFTQGLTYHPATQTLYESAGLYKKSSLREVDPSTGEVLRTVSVNDMYFAEGLTVAPATLGDQLTMLTWKERTGFTFKREDFSKTSTFAYTTHNGEGWGITVDADGNYVVSDGSSFLFTWDAATRKETSRVEVHTSDGSPVKYINELEAYFGDILANVWYADIILRIDPATGLVKAVYDFKDLWPHEQRPRQADCFNGIALLDNESKELLVTGKMWDKYFVVRLDDLPS
jgi:glutamine cyclotransferase